MGIASLILAAFTIILEIIAMPILIAGAKSASSIRSAEVMLTVGVGFLFLFIAILALILGIVGTVRNDPKIYAIIGLIISIIALGYILVLMVYGFVQVRF